MLAEVLDRLIAYAAGDEAELLAAREAWAQAAGRVFDDDPLYEERTVAFLEWYVLDRPSPDGFTPAERFLRADPALPSETLAWVTALAHSHRTLLQLRRLREGALTVDDLLGGGSFEVTERRRMAGFEEGEIFEARLVADVDNPPSVLFARAFQFHPREAQRPILRIATRAARERWPREATLFRLLQLRLKALRYRHVSADKIYADPA
jgi:hypothetical protein